MYASYHINRDELIKGLYCIGSSRCGKTTLLKWIIAQHIDARDSFSFIDVEGSVWDTAIRHIVRNADRENAHIKSLVLRYQKDVRRTILIDPTGPAVTPFNLLAPDPEYDPFTVVEALIAVFREVWAESFTTAAARMEDLLRSGCLLLAHHNLTLNEFDDLLINPRVARDLAELTGRQELIRFWGDYRDMLSKGRFREWSESTRNKISAVSASPFLGPMFGTTGCIDLAQALDDGKRVFIRLSEDHLRDHLRLIATLFVTKYSMDSGRRAEGARPHLLHLDEFQSFPTTIAERIISRRQKRGLGVAVYHQNRHQIPEDLLDSLLNNMHTRIAFQVGHHGDAEYFAKQMFPLTGEQVKRQKMDKLYWVFPYEASEPKFWSVQEELQHFARQLEEQRVGEATLSFFGKGATETYWLKVPQFVEPPPPPKEHVDAFIEMCRHEHGVTRGEAGRQAKASQDRLNELLTLAKKRRAT